jgi:WD40 repeat protein
MKLTRCLAGLAVAWSLYPGVALAQKGAGKFRDQEAEPTFHLPDGLHRDAAGDLLPPGAVARLGSGRLRHLMPELSFSPDGKTLLSWDSSVRFWDAATGREVRRLVIRGRRSLSAFALSPDNKTLAFATAGGPLLLLDAATGATLRRLEVGPRDRNPFRHEVAFAPDGQTLAFSDGKTIQLWDPKTGERTDRLTPPRKDSRGRVPLAFSADGESLNGVGGRWDLVSGKRLWAPDAADQAWLRVLSPDGKRLVVFNGGQLELREPASGKVVHRFTGEEFFGERNRPSLLRLSPDGATLAALSMDRQVRLYDVASGKQLFRVPGETGYVPLSLAFSPDGKTLAFVRQGSRIALWDVATRKERLFTAGPHVGFKALALSGDGRCLVSLTEDRALALWDVAARKPTAHAIKAPQFEGGFAFLPDGTTLATYGRGGLHLWATPSGKYLRHISLEPGRGLSSFAVSPDGKVVALTDGYTKVTLAEMATGKTLDTFKDSSAQPGRQHVGSLLFSPDGQTLVVTYRYGDSVLRDWRTGTDRRALRQAFIVSAFFDPVGKTLLACSAGRGDVVLWDLATGKRRWEERGDLGGGSFVADGRLLLGSGGGPTLHLWEAATRGTRLSIPTHHGKLTQVAVAASAPVAVTAHDDGTLLVWDVRRLGTPAARPPRLSARALEKLWGDLARRDAAVAQRALVELGARPAQALPLLKERLTALSGDRAGRLSQGLAGLESARFRAREEATRALEQAGKWAEPALRRRLAGKPPLEVKRRVEQLLAKLEAADGLPPDGGWLQALRGAEALERLGTPEARRALEALAALAPETWVSREARAALGRWPPAKRGP